MKKTILKISMLIAGLIFVFTSASWADNGKNRHRKYAPQKRIQAKHHSGSSYHRPVQYKHKFYHRKRWIQKHKRLQRLRRNYRHDRRQYSDNSYEDDAAYNEFSIAATISEPGVEFSIGTKRTW